MSEKCLLDQWRDMAYDRELSKEQLEKFWGRYFSIERGIYEQLLTEPDVEVKGTVKELAEKYGQEVLTMVGFLDGINDSLKVPNPIETMTEDTEVNLIFDKELLYKNMIDAKADWLNSCTVSRNSPVRSAKERKSEEMIHVHAEVVKNIKCAVEEMHSSISYERELG